MVRGTLQVWEVSQTSQSHCPHAVRVWGMGLVGGRPAQAESRDLEAPPVAVVVPPDSWRIFGTSKGWVTFRNTCSATRRLGVLAVAVLDPDA